jgi:hypothetical protein
MPDLSISEFSTPRRVLHLVVEGFPPDRLKELDQAAPAPSTVTEIFQLTESNAPEALEKIFAADTIAVWTKTI